MRCGGGGEPFAAEPRSARSDANRASGNATPLQRDPFRSHDSNPARALFVSLLQKIKSQKR